MASTTSDAATEGPVLSLINKRLRALRKKQNRIAQMEASLSRGKTLNKEQEEALASKPTLLGAIDELEKLRLLLPAALAEEPNNPTPPPPPPPPEQQTLDLGVVEDLLKLVYFGTMFDVKTGSEFVGMMYRKSHERGCCLTYDYVTEDDGDLLGEGDLDFIAKLGGLLVSRPLDSSLSHRDALERCVEHAKMWVLNSESPIAPDANVTCMLSEYRMPILKYLHFVSNLYMLNCGGNWNCRAFYQVNWKIAQGGLWGKLKL